jgi:hypothetical protein
VLSGLAECYRRTEQYREALELYAKLKAPLTPADEAYWRLQLSYCACSLEVARGDAGALRRLAAYIRQLDATGRPGFREIYREAERLLGEAAGGEKDSAAKAKEPS